MQAAAAAAFMPGPAAGQLALDPQGEAAAASGAGLGGQTGAGPGGEQGGLDDGGFSQLLASVLAAPRIEFSDTPGFPTSAKLDRRSAESAGTQAPRPSGVLLSH